MSNLIVHQIQSIDISLRYKDAYVNATELSKAYKAKTGKRREPSDWLRQKRTQETLNHLSTVTGIPVTKLTFTVQGGDSRHQGTWLHPRLAVRFGIWLSDEFGLAVENWIADWQNIAVNRQNQQWLESRRIGKLTRREETDTIKTFIEYATAQGSKNAAKYYINLTRMTNKALFLVEQKYPNLREVLDASQLTDLKVADKAVEVALRDGMDRELFYKDIYKLAKSRVESLVGITGGPTLVPAVQPLLISD